MVLIFLLYALLASTFTLGKILLIYAPPLFLTAIRMSVAGLLLLGVHYLFNKKKQLSFSLQDCICFLFISFVHILIPYSTEFFALQNVASSCAALVYNLSPFFTALFSYLVFHEVMTPKKWLGFGLGLIGIIYFIRPEQLCYGGFDWSYGLLLISVSSASLGWVIVRYFINSRGFSILFINGVAMLLAGIESFVLSWFLQEQAVLPWGHMQNFLTLLGLIILIANVLFYNLYGYLLKRYTATLLSFIGFTTPLFTALYDWLFLGYHVSSNFFISIAIVACGIYIFYQEELRQSYIDKD